MTFVPRRGWTDDVERNAVSLTSLYPQLLMSLSSDLRLYRHNPSLRHYETKCGKRENGLFSSGEDMMVELPRHSVPKQCAVPNTHIVVTRI